MISHNSAIVQKYFLPLLLVLKQANLLTVVVDQDQVKIDHACTIGSNRKNTKEEKMCLTPLWDGPMTSLTIKHRMYSRSRITSFGLVHIHPPTLYWKISCELFVVTILTCHNMFYSIINVQVLCSITVVHQCSLT